MLQLESLLQNRYLIRAVLGKGGMGAVYLAVDRTLNKRVAVKENLYSTPEYNRQFKIEAQIMANITHKNLPKVYDYFEIPQQGQYMVMDYIDGEDLRQRLERKGAIENEDAILIALAICDALEYLHNLIPPIIHRDIKPGNIKVNEDGNIYLVDFGLAKIFIDSQLTATGARAMTPGYSPPEQYGTARTDPRSDIYSLGATLYAVLTSVLPEDSLAIAMEQADLTPLRARNLNVSVPLARIVEKCLEIHPDDRFQTVIDLRESLIKASKNSKHLKKTTEFLVDPPNELELPLIDLLDEQQSTNRALYSPNRTIKNSLSRPENNPNNASLARQKLIAKRKRKKKSRDFLLRILLGICIVYISYGGLTVDWKLQKPFSIFEKNLAPYIATSTPVPTLVPTQTSTPQQLISTEPISIVTSTLIPTLTSTPILIPTKTNAPTITPTSTITVTPSKTPIPSPTAFAGNDLFLYVSNQSGQNQIWLDSINHNVSSSQITFNDGGSCQPSWSPDGTKIVFISPCIKPNNLFYYDTKIYIQNLETQEQTILIPESGVFSPKWSPDGMNILFSKLENEYVIDIYKMNIQTGLLTKLVENQHRNLNPSWHPTENTIFYASNKIDAYRIMQKECELLSQAIEITKEIGAEHNTPIMIDNGNLLLFTSRENDSYPRLKYIDMTLENKKETGEYLNNILIPQSQPSISSDENWILFTTWESGNYDIYLMNKNGSGIQKIVSSENFESQPVWKP